jgi:hypothetical protein
MGDVRRRARGSGQGRGTCESQRAEKVDFQVMDLLDDGGRDGRPGEHVTIAIGGITPITYLGKSRPWFATVRSANL